MAANLTKRDPGKRNAPVRFDVTIPGTDDDPVTIRELNYTDLRFLLSVLRPDESVTVRRTR